MAIIKVIVQDGCSVIDTVTVGTGINTIVINGSSFTLYKNPSNTVNLTTLEINDVISGFTPTGDYIIAKYLGGDNTDFTNELVYNIFNGI